MNSTTIVGYRVHDTDGTILYYCTDGECTGWMWRTFAGAQCVPLTADGIQDELDNRDGRHIYCECGTMLSRSSYPL